MRLIFDIPHLFGSSVNEGTVFLIRVFALAICVDIVLLFFYFGKHFIHPEKNVCETFSEVSKNSSVKVWVFSTIFLLLCYFYVIYRVING
jgi:hypothetical protein